jgi:alkylation response protein AidB-like acyl-CoA dehydrogenase
MSFFFNETQKERQLAARKFAEEVLRPAAHKIDAEAAFPSEALRQMADLGFAGLSIPKERAHHLPGDRRAR